MVMMPRHTPASFTHTTRVDRTYTAQERERDGRKKGYRDMVRVSRVHSDGGQWGQAATYQHHGVQNDTVKGREGKGRGAE